jgi:hypothetical protein
MLHTPPRPENTAHGRDDLGVLARAARRARAILEMASSALGLASRHAIPAWVVQALAPFNAETGVSESARDVLDRLLDELRGHRTRAMLDMPDAQEQERSEHARFLGGLLRECAELRAEDASAYPGALLPHALFAQLRETVARASGLFDGSSTEQEDSPVPIPTVTHLLVEAASLAIVLAEDHMPAFGGYAARTRALVEELAALQGNVPPKGRTELKLSVGAEGSGGNFSRLEVVARLPLADERVPAADSGAGVPAADGGVA